MVHFFTIVFYQPILNLLVYLYNTISFHDLGLAIIFLTAVLKLILWPLGRSAIKSQKSLQDLQPKINELKKEYGNDKTALSRATMDLYKNNKVNPFSSCLPLLIQLPFLIAVYRVFRDGVNNKLDYVYSFISRPETINLVSFGFLDLGKPSIPLAVLAGLAQFWQAKMMITKQPVVKTPGSKDESMAAIMNKQMLYFMPAITIFIGISLPGGLTLYWFVLTLLTVLQQLVTFRKKSGTAEENKIIEGDIVK
ncbi:MAG: YidC/Oxa1 family membrane protein insertase [Candidatus Falkowbacteria bacterium]|nr:YidC/Oxa1 family membrane protein insertase [Candidatus Falkowbacteria bacterium]